MVSAACADIANGMTVNAAMSKRCNFPFISLPWSAQGADRTRPVGRADRLSDAFVFV
jgi:hypothetical protein